jgi:hypothetical protein
MTKSALVPLFSLVAFTAGLLLGKGYEPGELTRRNVSPEDWLVVVRSDPDGPHVDVKNNWLVISLSHPSEAVRLRRWIQAHGVAVGQGWLEKGRLLPQDDDDR